MELRYKTGIRLSPKAKLMGRMKLGMFFSLSEGEFSQYIKEVESGEIFQKLLHRYKIVQYRKFSGIRQTPAHIELKEELTPGDSFDFSALVEKDPEGWQVVKEVAPKMGEENFSQFLRGDNISFDKISKEYQLTLEKMEKFRNFINNFHLQQNFFNQAVPDSFSPSFFQVAIIEKQDDEFFVLPINDSTYLIKGRYIINYKKLEILVEQRQIPQDILKKISTLFRKLDIINKRTTTLYRILSFIKEKQHNFLLSGDSQDMVPLTQREIAKSIGADPSTISRVIAGKSIITPWGSEKALKDFFMKKKEKIKANILDIIKNEEEIFEREDFVPLTDGKIKKELERLFGVQISRRTVGKYRKELGIPSCRKRSSGKLV